MALGTVGGYKKRLSSIATISWNSKLVRRDSFSPPNSNPGFQERTYLHPSGERPVASVRELPPAAAEFPSGAGRFLFPGSRFPRRAASLPRCVPRCSQRLQRHQTISRGRVKKHGWFWCVTTSLLLLGDTVGCSGHRYPPLLSSSRSSSLSYPLGKRRHHIPEVLPGSVELALPSSRSETTQTHDSFHLS